MSSVFTETKTAPSLLAASKQRQKRWTVQQEPEQAVAAAEPPRRQSMGDESALSLEIRETS